MEPTRRYLRRFATNLLDWTLTSDESELVDRVVSNSINLLASIYGTIYFPTYSNGLKEIARWLGFDWSWPQASGGASMLLRRCWELTYDDRLRRELIAYNMEDCRAAAMVAEAIAFICSNNGSGATKKLQTINVSSLEVGFQRTFGKFPSALPEFEKINAAAYWNYQRSKVYVRTNKALRRNLEKAAKPVKEPAVDQEIFVEDKPSRCAKCGSPKLWVGRRKSRIVSDLRFTRRGIKRWVVRYRHNSYRCGVCNAEVTIRLRDSKCGQSLRAYVIYLLIEMRLSHQKIAEHLATAFGIPFFKSMVGHIKSAMAKKYEPTYRHWPNRTNSRSFTSPRSGSDFP